MSILELNFQSLCMTVHKGVFFFFVIVQQQCPPSDLGFNFDANKQQRQLIAELENKNRYSVSFIVGAVLHWLQLHFFFLPGTFFSFREILQEIQRLRLEHEQASQPTPEKAQQNPTLLTELRLLRYN